KELIIPPPATRDMAAIEMIRVWIAEKGLHSTINIGVYKENGHNEARAWGIILADIAKHISNAMNEEYGDDKTLTVKMIARSLAEELQLPTSDVEGYFWSE